MYLNANLQTYWQHIRYICVLIFRIPIGINYNLRNADMFFNSYKTESIHQFLKNKYTNYSFRIYFIYFNSICLSFSDNFSNIHDILNIRILKGVSTVLGNLKYIYMHWLNFVTFTISRNSFRMTLIVYQIYIDHFH